MKAFFTFLAISELLAGFNPSKGQVVEASKSNQTIYVPNMLKINAEGRLEKWVISNLENYPENQVKLFNRRGQLVFHTRNYQNNWPEGIPSEDKYYYILEIDGKRISGWVEILL